MEKILDIISGKMQIKELTANGASEGGGLRQVRSCAISVFEFYGLINIFYNPLRII